MSQIFYQIILITPSNQIDYPKPMTTREIWKIYPALLSASCMLWCTGTVIDWGTFRKVTHIYVTLYCIVLVYSVGDLAGIYLFPHGPIGDQFGFLENHCRFYAPFWIHRNPFNCRVCISLFFCLNDTHDLCVYLLLARISSGINSRIAGDSRHVSYERSRYLHFLGISSTEVLFADNTDNMGHY